MRRLDVLITTTPRMSNSQNIRHSRVTVRDTGQTSYTVLKEHVEGRGADGQSHQSICEGTIIIFWKRCREGDAV